MAELPEKAAAKNFVTAIARFPSIAATTAVFASCATESGYHVLPISGFQKGTTMRISIVVLIGLTLAAPLAAQTTRPRGRDLGIPFPGKTGPNNAITDVDGIAVGHVTLIEG